MRTTLGPQGQPPGTITTNPDEVDAIVIATLQQVCNGNAEDHSSLVTNFIDKHREDIFHADEFAMEDIGTVSFRTTAHKVLIVQEALIIGPLQTLKFSAHKHLFS